MRIRITDGPREVEIRAKGYSRRRLDDAENAALRLLDALCAGRLPEPGTVFGFTSDVSLDSSVERAEAYVEPDREGDECEDQVQ
jgi:hypothetical protein